MAPQHIDDLPRHEEPRKLMSGLIDDCVHSSVREYIAIRYIDQMQFST